MKEGDDMLARVSRWIVGVSLLLVVATACGTGVTPAPNAKSMPPTKEQAEPLELTVMTHDSFAVSEDLIRKFEADNQAKLIFVKSGDTGAALNRAILTKNAPTADIFYGVDNTFLSRALAEDLFEPYSSPLLRNIPAEFIIDPTNRALPVDSGDVCINYDKAYFNTKGLAVPASLDDLLKPEYKGLLAVQNPATSSPGLAFLIATIAQYGPQGYLDYWRALRENGVVVVGDWETAYYTNFSASSGKGPQTMVVSYGTSPAAEVIFADPRPEDAPTASILAQNTCFRQIEFVGILKGSSQRPLAEKFVDFLLDVPFQEDLALQMFVYPVNPNAKIPAEFELYAQRPDQPAQLSPQEIAANREAWINAWDEVVIR
jgi:thiamine transport system substrate-binding protein